MKKALRLGERMTGDRTDKTRESAGATDAKRRDRDARLVSALRRNLLKRKDQQRARAAEENSEQVPEC